MHSNDDLTRDQAAALLGISRSTVYHYYRLGYLKARVEQTDLQPQRGGARLVFSRADVLKYKEQRDKKIGRVPMTNAEKVRRYQQRKKARLQGQTPTPALTV